MYFCLFFTAPFFVDCISEQDLDEMNIEIIRNTLYKAYLEAFYKFCEDIGGTTAETMCEILAVSFSFFILIRGLKLKVHLKQLGSWKNND